MTILHPVGIAEFYRAQKHTHGTSAMYLVCLRRGSLLYIPQPLAATMAIGYYAIVLTDIVFEYSCSKHTGL